VVVSNVACIDNRRQGMSIGQSSNVKVLNSEFSHTGGIAPACGIDIEPDVNMAGTATGILIEGCSIHSNAGNGIQVYKDCKETTIKRCAIEGNTGYGVLAIGAAGGQILQNHFTSNSLNGIGIRSDSRNYTVKNNHFYNNGRRFRNRDLAKRTPPTSRSGDVLPRHTQISGSQNIQVQTNLYYD
jgi:hypothetical protein